MNRDAGRAGIELEPAKLVQMLSKSVPGQSVLAMMAEEAGSVLGGRNRVPPPLAPMSQTLRQILPYLQNGDLLMMRSESFAARFVQQVTGCQFCHIGVILRLPELPYSPLLLEADPQVRPTRSTSPLPPRPFDPARSTNLSPIPSSRIGVCWCRAQPPRPAHAAPPLPRGPPP